MNFSNSSLAAGFHALVVVIAVGLSILVAAKGLIELAYLVVDADSLSWQPFFEVFSTTLIILLLLKQRDWLRTFALILALAGIGGFVKVGIEFTRAYSIGIPLIHSPAQYFELVTLYGFFVLSFFGWYFWDNAKERKRRRARRRRSAS